MYTPPDAVNIHEAKTYFSKLVDAASKGKEILIAKAGVPVARLVSLDTKQNKVRFGAFKGKMKLASDFDAPLPDDVIDSFMGK